MSFDDGSAQWNLLQVPSAIQEEEVESGKMIIDPGAGAATSMGEVEIVDSSADIEYADYDDDDQFTGSPLAPDFAGSALYDEPLLGSANDDGFLTEGLKPKRRGRKTKAITLSDSPATLGLDDDDGTTMKKLRKMRKADDPVLSEIEENHVVNFVIRVQECGFFLSSDDICNRAAEVASLYGSDDAFHQLGQSWFDEFCQKHQLDIKEPCPFPTNPTDAQNLFQQCLRQLDSLMMDAKVQGKPEQIYALSQVYIDDLGDVTLLACASAAGHMLPPFVLFRGEDIKLGMARKAYPGAYFISTPEGIIDSTVFLTWFREHFLRNVQRIDEEETIFLIVDAPGSQVSVQLVTFAEDAQIEYGALAPHTTTICNPLIVSVLPALQKAMYDKANDFKTANPSLPVTRSVFATFLRAAWGETTTPHNIINGFTQSGIFPTRRKPPHATKDTIQEFIEQPHLPTAGFAMKPAFEAYKTKATKKKRSSSSQTDKSRKSISKSTDESLKIDKSQRLVDVFPDLVGRRIRHCWKVGRQKVWYDGEIMGLSKKNARPLNYDGDKKGTRGLPNSPCVDVRYDSDDTTYSMILDPDWRNGELEVVV